MRDEERVIGACLQSAMPYVTRVVAIDTGSKDRTIEIAEKMGAHVICREWPDSFSIARNYALAETPPDRNIWVLVLDADDTLPPATGEAIRSAARNAPPEVVGFVIPVQFVEEDGTPGGTRVDHVKLYRNLPGLEYEGRIHEQIVRSLRATGGEIARLDAVVLHTGYDTSPAGQAKKRARDAKLLKLDLEDRPGHPFVLFNLGMTDHYGGAHESAVEWLRRCLEVSAPSDSIVRKAYALLAMSLRELGRLDEFAQTLDQGLAIYPDDPELQFHLAHLQTSQGRLAEAKERYQRCLKADISPYFTSVDMGIMGYKTFHNIAGVSLAMGDYSEARRWWLRAIEAAPKYVASAQELFHAALDARDTSTARLMLDKLLSLQTDAASRLLLEAKYLQAIGSFADAEARLVRAAEQADAPAAQSQARLALARQLLNQERVSEAKPLLELLASSGVAEAAFFMGVSAVRGGDIVTALNWMERAMELNPQHIQTREQVANLRAVLRRTG